MKNIHVLPTDKPSRLYFYKGEDVYPPQYGLRSLKSLPSKDSFTNQNIYITSDEEIIEGDGSFILDLRSNKLAKNINNHIKVWNENCKKITLTTDQELIKDGVQAIDDEFLEWFVKNPSCKIVDIGTSLLDGKNGYGYYGKYKIIISKEEPKQETLEEVAERILGNNIDGLKDALQDNDLFFFYKGVIQCYCEAMAKWQQEQTIKEVFEWLTTNNYLTDLKETMVKDFNIFKNK